MNELKEILIELPIAIIVMFLLFRVMGNKEMHQSSPLDFAFMVIMASIAWDMTLTQEHPLWATFLMMIIIVIMTYLFEWITSRSRKIEKLFIGESLLLINNGQVEEEILIKERMSLDELRARLRLKGIFSTDEVAVCYLEFNGDISVKKKE